MNKENTTKMETKKDIGHIRESVKHLPKQVMTKEEFIQWLKKIY